VGAVFRKTIVAKRAVRSLPPGSLAHLHCGFRSWAYATQCERIRCIATIHGMVPARGIVAIRDVMDLYLLSKRASSLVAVSRHCKQTVERMVRMRNPVGVIPNGVPCSLASSPTRTDSLVNVGFAGDFSFNKGIHTFLEIARILKHMPARFTVFGKGPEYALVEKAAGEGFVRWIDNETEPAKIFEEMDIFVFPSRLEGPDTTGCPMVVLEAKSYGVPTVASNIPGVREIIGNGEDGILLDGWDALDYAAVVERLITVSEMRQTLSECAKQKCASEFSADLMARRYLQLASSLW
jgi:glycosyltransferase involved in cell wall biosynthesis